MKEPEGNVIVEDEDGELWRPNSERLWICQTDQGWARTWAELMERITVVAVFVDWDEHA